MISNITWGQYFIIVVFVLAFYYLFLIIRFSKNREDITDRLDEFKDEFKNANYDLEEQHQLTDQLFDQAEALIDKLILIIGQMDNKEQLLGALRKELAKHPSLNIAAFRAGINNRIHEELQQIGIIQMSEREIEGLW